jgi:peptidoglycan/xylan/chitin deacetylase (PgdA/CDA1 family)
METTSYNNPYGFEGVITPRSMLRQTALSTLAALYRGVGATSYWLSQPRIQFLYLHHLFPEEEQGFRRLLELLGKTHWLISYSEAVQRVQRNEIDGPYVCFSFDDGLRQNVRAAEILKEFGATACFFICPGLIGETSREKIEEICVKRFKMPATSLLSWDDVDRMVSEGHEIGSHTMTHQVLSRISDQELEDEIGESYEALTRRLGSVRHFAWPEGRFFHFSAAARRLVFDAGFLSCASAERGCHIGGTGASLKSLCLRRDYVSARWPLSHTFYFMTRASRRASALDSRWPEAFPEDWE